MLYGQVNFSGTSFANEGCSALQNVRDFFFLFFFLISSNCKSLSDNSIKDLLMISCGSH